MNVTFHCTLYPFRINRINPFHTELVKIPFEVGTLPHPKQVKNTPDTWNKTTLGDFHAENLPIRVC